MVWRRWKLSAQNAYSPLDVRVEEVPYFGRKVHGDAGYTGLAGLRRLRL